MMAIFKASASKTISQKEEEMGIVLFTTKTYRQKNCLQTFM